MTSSLEGSSPHDRGPDGAEVLLHPVTGSERSMTSDAASDAEADVDANAGAEVEAETEAEAGAEVEAEAEAEPEGRKGRGLIRLAGVGEDMSMTAGGTAPRGTASAPEKVGGVIVAAPR